MAKKNTPSWRDVLLFTLSLSWKTAPLLSPKVTPVGQFEDDEGVGQGGHVKGEDVQVLVTIDRYIQMELTICQANMNRSKRVMTMLSRTRHTAAVDLKPRFWQRERERRPTSSQSLNPGPSGGKSHDCRPDGNEVLSGAFVLVDGTHDDLRQSEEVGHYVTGVVLDCRPRDEDLSHFGVGSKRAPAV